MDYGLLSLSLSLSQSTGTSTQPLSPSVTRGSNVAWALTSAYVFPFSMDPTDAAGKVNASSVLSKRTAVKKKSITVLRAEESRLLTANENLEKELKMLKENYVILLQQNNCLKTLHERMPIVSSEKAAIPAAADESKQGTNAHCQEPIPCEDYRPVPLQTSRIPDYIRDPAFFVRACKEVFALPDLNLLAEDDGRER